MEKIIIAPDSFKGSLNAVEVTSIIYSVARAHFPEAQILKLPIADGGEGLVDALLNTLGGKKINARVLDPLARSIDSFYGILPDGQVVVEMAAASGLPLLATSERNPLRTSTYGTGQLILDALQKGYRQFILGLGGSATNDGGAGAAAALGIRYLDSNQNLILSGGGLSHLSQIDTSQMAEGLSESTFVIACDVTNPLYGPSGATAVFGPQKGASTQDLTLLDEGLRTLAQVVEAKTGLDLNSIPGSGAAGGLVVPFLAFCEARMKSGLDVVLNALNFDQHLSGCNLVITGEGRTDAQSTMGKALSGIGLRCLARGVPVIAISGSLGEGYELLYQQGITACFAAVQDVSSLEVAMAHAAENLAQATENVFRLIKGL